MPKRENYISWDEFFMGAAMLCAKRSKDPNTQVGACIVNPENRIVSVGYNGFPAGCDDDVFPWERSAEDRFNTKYLYVCHAELNAILNARGTNLTGNRLYVALFPCNECAKAIIQSGISEVIYLSNKYADTPETRASKRMLEAAGVKLTQLIPEKSELILDFDPDKI
ncbi:MAG: dCMP deaminase family protein [Clostridia bacterium]|nr:dCMP deaminase family protein [Clostridia bacterium]